MTTTSATPDYTDHATAASEMLRVTRPGGRIAMANWTPKGFIGRLFRINDALQVSQSIDVMHRPGPWPVASHIDHSMPVFADVGVARCPEPERPAISRN